MQPEYQIAALWMHSPLSYLEQLCLKSFVDAGHHVKLFVYDTVPNVPDKIEIADANEILPQAGFLKHERTGSPALHSDLFRYRLLEKYDRTIWADTDAYCVRKFETPNGHFYGWESNTHINGGVLGLPQDSETLGQLLEFTSDEFAIPDWYTPEYRDELIRARDAGNPVHAGEQPWGVWGPHALTYFLQKTGEAKYAFPREYLYPFSFKERLKMLKPRLDVSSNITDHTYSVHFYGRRMRPRIVEKENGVPHHKSLIGGYLAKHGIDTSAAPIPTKKMGLQPIPAADKYGRGLVNLTDLADKYGSDKGSTKHRYSELYNLLFQPFRDRPINFLEMGLLIGGPEHGKDANRKTDDLPSIRMWLEYFNKAKIIGLDVSDFSWFSHERFDFIRCDMDEKTNIESAAEDMPELDIIIDDASHASHHQQNAFPVLFPKLRSGGMYIIEDLRWQPKSYERPGIVRTADLMQTYVKGGVFQHNSAETQQAFNDLRHDISGCFIFPAKFIKGNRDQVAVIHKR